MYEWYMFLWLTVSILFVFCFAREALRRRRIFIRNAMAEQEVNIARSQGVRHHQMYVYSISTANMNAPQSTVNTADDLPPKYEEVVTQPINSQTVK